MTKTGGYDFPGILQNLVSTHGNILLDISFAIFLALTYNEKTGTKLFGIVG
jgi:hypothetical protein